jgi:hypothetical protein
LLVGRQRGAEIDRVSDRRGQIVDLDVEVRHHLLVPVRGRPDRPDVGRFALEAQVRRAVRQTDDGPAGSVLAIGQVGVLVHVPSQQSPRRSRFRLLFLQRGEVRDR